MKIVKKEHYIPANTVITTVYIASDGKEFTSENDCIAHEKQIEIANHPIYTSAIKNVYTFEDEDWATLFYISSQEDYEYFKETQGIKTERYFHSDFNEYGVGWYIFYVIDGGDYPSYQYLYNYNAYEHEIELRWKKYKKDMRYKMEQYST